MEAIYPILFHGGLRVMLVQILEDPVMGREGSYLIVILIQLLKNFPPGREWFIKSDNSSRVCALAEPGQRGCHSSGVGWVRVDWKVDRSEALMWVLCGPRRSGSGGGRFGRTSIHIVGENHSHHVKAS